MFIFYQVLIMRAILEENLKKAFNVTPNKYAKASRN
jgi:hypothetical protein